jgi:hypothetical protein
MKVKVNVNFNQQGETKNATSHSTLPDLPEPTESSPEPLSCFSKSVCSTGLQLNSSKEQQLVDSYNPPSSLSGVGSSSPIHVGGSTGSVEVVATSCENYWIDEEETVNLDRTTDRFVLC